MEKNVGDKDAYLRISCGLTLLGFGVMDRSRFLVAVGAMKVAEGITRWCPILHLLGRSTACEQQAEAPQEVHPDALFTE